MDLKTTQSYAVRHADLESERIIGGNLTVNEIMRVIGANSSYAYYSELNQKNHLATHFVSNAIFRISVSGSVGLNGFRASLLEALASAQVRKSLKCV